MGDTPSLSISKIEAEDRHANFYDARVNLRQESEGMQNGCGVPTEVLPEGDDYGCVSGLRPRWYVPRQSSGAHPRQRGAGVAVRRVADIVMGPSVWLALAVLLLALAPAGTPGS